MRKLECPLSHNKQHHQQKQQADEEVKEEESYAYEAVEVKELQDSRSVHL